MLPLQHRQFLLQDFYDQKLTKRQALEQMSQTWANEWCVDLDAFQHCTLKHPDTPSDNVQVLTDTVWLPGGRLVSMRSPILLCQHIDLDAAGHARAMRPQAKANAKGTAKSSSQPAWMEGALLSMAKGKGKAGSTGTPKAGHTPARPAAEAPGKPSEEGPEPEPMEDAVKEAYCTELESMRKAWSLHYDARSEDFTSEIRGTKWTWEHKALPGDVVVATASSKLGTWWLSHYGLQAMVSFDIAQHALPTAASLAMGWMHRMQGFLNMWVEAGRDEAFQYTDAHHGAYKPHPDFLAFMRELDPRGAARARIADFEKPKHTPRDPQDGPAGAKAKGRARGRGGGKRAAGAAASSTD